MAASQSRAEKNQPEKTQAETRDRILEIAERLVQTRGFNAFSYADVAAELDITKASLHYHFPTKAELGETLVSRCNETFAAERAAIAQAKIDDREKLRRYVAIYQQVLINDRMCLCGMLSAEIDTLPDPMRAGVRRFFDENEIWLGDFLDHARRAGALKFEGDAHEAAQALTATLEGAMLLARSYGDVARFRAVADRALAELGVPPPRRKR